MSEETNEIFEEISNDGKTQEDTQEDIDVQAKQNLDIDKNMQENSDNAISQEIPAMSSTSKKGKKKKIILIAIIAVVAIGVIIGGIFAIKAFSKATTISEIQGISDDYQDREFIYNEAINKLDAYNEETDTDILTAVNTEKTELSALRTSVESYYAGKSLLEIEDYMSAAIDFNKVQENSKLYEDARNQVDELKDKCKEATLTKVDEYVANENYSAAIKELTNYFSVYYDTELSEKKSELETTLSEKEAAEKAAEEEAERENAKSQLRITGCWVKGPDSVNGYELYLNYKNLSDKTINYLTFGVSFINRVGDVVNTWRVDEVEYCHHTGPIAPGEGLSGSNWCWGKYYDSDIDYPSLKYIQVEYSDGTTWLLNENEIAAVQY